MFIVSCKYTADNKVIFDCIKSIKTFFPEEKIVVVNAASSESNDYCKDLGIFDFITRESDTYEVGAYTLAYEKYPDEENYNCIQDSVIMKSNFKYDEFKIIQYLVCGSWDPYFTKYRLHKDIETIMNIKIPNIYAGVGCNTIFCNKDIMKGLYNVMKHFIPCDKYESNMSECIFGLALYSLGFDITKYAIQGQHIQPIDNLYDTSIIEKRWFGRL